MSESKISLVISVEGGDADSGMIDLYDAAVMVEGLAQTLNTVTHAFLNECDLRQKSATAHGAKAFLTSANKGCFEQHIDIYFPQKSINKIGKTKFSNNFWDYLCWSWSVANGLAYEIKTEHLRDLLQKTENISHEDEVADRLESSMRRIHRMIANKKKPATKIQLDRPYVGTMLTLNKKTLDFVSVRDVVDLNESIFVNITRFNIITNYGRLHSINDNKIIPFNIDENAVPRVKEIIADSLRDGAYGGREKILVKVKKIENSRGVIKRYIVQNAFAGDENE